MGGFMKNINHLKLGDLVNFQTGPFGTQFSASEYTKEGIPVINVKDIGFGKATGWRAHYPNDGTIYQQGQDFKEKTINEMTPRAREIYAEKIKEGLGL